MRKDGLNEQDATLIQSTIAQELEAHIAEVRSALHEWDGTLRKQRLPGGSEDIDS